MNVKRIIGSGLTVLGIAGLVYAAILFVNTSGGMKDVRGLITYGLIGLLFFGSGISLIRTIKDEA